MLPTNRQRDVGPPRRSPRSGTLEGRQFRRGTVDRRLQRPVDAPRTTWHPPERPENYQRRRIATGLTLAALILIALALVLPSVGYALVQWFVIAVAVGSITVYLRRQWFRNGANDFLNSPARRGRRQ